MGYFNTFLLWYLVSGEELKTNVISLQKKITKTTYNLNPNPQSVPAILGAFCFGG